MDNVIPFESIMPEKLAEQQKRPEIFRYRVLKVVREAGLEVYIFHFMYSNQSILAK